MDHSGLSDALLPFFPVAQPPKTGLEEHATSASAAGPPLQGPAAAASEGPAAESSLPQRLLAAQRMLEQRALPEEFDKFLKT